MKKVIAFFLVIISVFAFGVSAFAENEIKRGTESDGYISDRRIYFF